MLKKSVKYYTIYFFAAAILLVIAIWTACFYWLITEEVYDNIDDGLKDSQIRIIGQLQENPDLLNTKEYDLAQFRFTALPPGDYAYTTHIYNSKMYMKMKMNQCVFCSIFLKKIIYPIN